MEITRDPPEFRPVTIRIETQDELDKLVAIVAGVARNSINHTPQVIAAAKDFAARLCSLLNEDN